MRAFRQQELSDLLEENDQKIKERIDSEFDDYILNVDEQTYAEFLADEYFIEPMILDFDKIHLTEQERNVSGEELASHTFADPNKTYKKQEITFHIPCSGTARILIRYKPNKSYTWSPEVFTEEGCVCYEVLNLDESNPNYVKKISNETNENLKAHLKFQTDQINDYNNSLKSNVLQILAPRKATLSKRKKTIETLGYPVMGQSTANTYSIPLAKKRSKIKPTIQSGTATVDPTLAEGDYNEILNIIYDAGKMIEKYPSSYKDNDEEQLRDALIVTLQTHLDASVTGETYNKSGKTDILLRYKSNNIFVAECKIWHGKKEYLEAIDQILSYLTWRDSKTAVVIFVKNKEITPINEIIENETKIHANFISSNEKSGESWFNFTFHLNGDKERKLKLAVLLFHLPN